MRSGSAFSSILTSVVFRMDTFSLSKMMTQSASANIPWREAACEGLLRGGRRAQLVEGF